jgi:hypothetical protein
MAGSFDVIKPPFPGHTPAKPLAANQFVKDIEVCPALPTDANVQLGRKKSTLKAKLGDFHSIFTWRRFDGSTYEAPP